MLQRRARQWAGASTDLLRKIRSEMSGFAHGYDVKKHLPRGFFSAHGRDQGVRSCPYSCRCRPFTRPFTSIKRSLECHFREPGSGAELKRAPNLFSHLEKHIWCLTVPDMFRSGTHAGCTEDYLKIPKDVCMYICVSVVVPIRQALACVFAEPVGDVCFSVLSTSRLIAVSEGRSHSEASEPGGTHDTCTNDDQQQCQSGERAFWKPSRGSPSGLCPTQRAPACPQPLLASFWLCRGAAVGQHCKAPARVPATKPLSRETKPLLLCAFDVSDGLR